MQTLSRRALFKDGLLAVGAGMGVPGIFNTMATARATLPRSARDHILVVVQIAGGLDGLHAIVPYTDPRYTQKRPMLAVPSANILPLTDSLGLHMQLGALKPLWDNQQMAIIENVGYPNSNLSHFQSMYIWQTLDMTGTQGAARVGWLGKYLQSAAGASASPFAGLCEGSTVPTALLTPDISITAIDDSSAFRLTPDNGAPERDHERTTGLIQIYQNYARSQPNNSRATRLASVANTTVSATEQFSEALNAYKPAVKYPETGLGYGLQTVALAITQKLPIRVGYVTTGGYDTHANQNDTLNHIYPDLAGSIAAFWQDLQAQGADQNVVMLTWSEFGRRVEENSSQGTDHGTAVPLFAFGPAISGGMYGDAPDLGQLDNAGNLIFKTDFRAVYATILDNWLGVDASSVLGGSFSKLDFLTGATA